MAWVCHRLPEGKQREDIFHVVQNVYVDSPQVPAKSAVEIVAKGYKTQTSGGGDLELGMA